MVAIDEKTGKPVYTFSSIRQAAIFTGNISNARNIKQVCYGKQKTAYGYGWAFKENNIEQKYYTNKKFRPVYKIDKDTNEIIDSYESTIEAARSLPNIKNYETAASVISKVCRGKAKTSYGYKWSYQSQ